MGALLLAACGRSGSGSGTPGSGGGGAGGGGAAGTASTGTAGAGMAGGGSGGGAAGAGVGGGPGRGGSSAGGTGGSGTAGSGTGGSGGAGGSTGASGSSGTCLSHDIDIPVSFVTAQISVQGLTSSTGSGTLDLRTAAGDRALLGTTMFFSSSASVLPGTYDVYYRLTNAGPGLPANTSAKIMSGVVVAPAPSQTTLDILVPATPVTVALTLTGITTSNVAGDSIHLRTAAGDDAPLGRASPTPVVPGTYDVYYVPAPATIGPVNSSAKLQSGFVVGASPVTLNVNVPGATVSGAFTLNGSKTPPAGSPTAAYGLSLRSAAGDRAGLASQLGAYSATVIPGTYDLYFNTSAGATGLVSSPSTLLQTGIVVGSGPLTLNVDVPATTVSGTITVNGAQVASPAGIGMLTLQNATTTWTFAATTTMPHSSTPAGAYATALVAGTYDLYYGVVTAGTGVPSNASVKLRSGVVIGTTSPQTLDVDIPATTVTGTITVNGAQVDSSMGTGALHLRNAAGDDALLGSTGVAGTYAQLVVPGTYDLAYAVINTGPGVPPNQSAKLRSGIVVGSTPLALDIDVAAPKVSGAITVNGMQSSGNPNAVANLVLQNASGDKALLGNTFGATYARYMIPGTYELMYENQTAGGLSPADNMMGDLGCYGVP